jgi:hypothetical protein
VDFQKEGKDTKSALLYNGGIRNFARLGAFAKKPYKCLTPHHF